jgi:predicted dienelactone hydrolase
VRHTSRERSEHGTAPTKTSGRTASLAAALIAACTFLVACASGELRDPASPGVYGVGMTTMTFTRASTTTGAPRPLETVIWYPTDNAGGSEPQVDALPATRGGPFPIVTFSHGDAGTPQETSYFTEHLASWGFVVVAPAHFGNRKQDCPCSAEATADSLRNRVPDINFVLDSVLALKDDPGQPIGRIIDAGRVADTGYSFGGLTAVAAAPAGRFDAVIAMAPGGPGLLLDAAKNTHIPTLLMAGGRDTRVDATEVYTLYDALPAGVPRYYLALPEAGHHAFRDECIIACEFPQERAHELIMRYATAFLEVYLVSDERYRGLLEQADPPGALLEHAAP